VKTPTPIMSAMTIAVAVAVDTVARFELPLLAGIIRLLATREPAYRCSPLCPQAGKRSPGRKNSTQAERAFALSRSSSALVRVCYQKLIIPEVIVANLPEKRAAAVWRSVRHRSTAYPGIFITAAAKR
jgi:hypothetical protein